MSEQLEARGEVIKLARLLSVEESDLAFVAGLPAGDIRKFREQSTDRLYDAGARALSRVGAAAAIMPSGLVASIAQRSFGPLLCARAAGTVDAAKAIDVARRLPPDFLADVTIALDPRRVAEIIASVPAELAVPVAAELGRREEHVTMGRFLAFVADDTTAAAMEVIDDEAMLRTAFVLEHKERLDHAIGLLPPERLPGILVNASRLGLWAEALDLLGHLSDARRGLVGDVMAEQDAPIIADLVRAVSDAGIWDSLLPVVRTMSQPSRVRLAAVPAFHDPDVMGEIIRAAARRGLWVDLVPLIDALPANARASLPKVAARLEPELLANILRDAAGAPETLPSLLTIVRDMDAGGRAQVITLIDEAPRQAADELVEALVNPDLIERILDAATPDILDAVTRAAAQHGREDELAQALAKAGATNS